MDPPRKSAPSTTRSASRRRRNRQPTGPQPIVIDEIVADYRKALSRIHGRAHWTRRPRLIDRSAYWPLALRLLSGADDVAPVNPDGLVSRSEERLPPTGLIVIEGDPGCGKTVLLDHLTWLAATTESCRLPVLVSLYRGVQSRRSRRSESGIPISASLEAVLRHETSSRTIDALTAVILSPAGVVLLDGWDEVPSRRRGALANEIVRAAQQTRVVLTTRRQQDLNLLGVDTEANRFEICELSDEVITLALEGELANARRTERTRHARLTRLQGHWQQRVTSVRYLARNAQMLRLLLEFYSAQRQSETLSSEATLVGEAIAHAGTRWHARFSPTELAQSGRVARTLGAWCWSALSDSRRRHGHREIVASELRPFWEHQGLRRDRLQGWLEHLAANTLWFQKTISGDAFGQESAYQIVHPLFVSYLAAVSLVARAQSVDAASDGIDTESCHVLLDDVLRELTAFASDADQGKVDKTVAAQICRFIGALMPLPRTLHLEDLLCRLLQLNGDAAARMALQLVAGESQRRASRTRSLVSSSSADQIAAHIRSKPRRDRVLMVRRWHEEIHRNRRTDENHAIEIFRALRGLLLTPSGRGTVGQHATAPMPCWIEKDSEVIVRAYALVSALQQLTFPDVAAAPDEYHQLWEGRLAMLAPARSTVPPSTGHWISIPSGDYFVGDDVLASDGRALARQRVTIGQPCLADADGSAPLMIGRYPVTSREFLEFDPERTAGPPYDEASRPVVFLSWFDAFVYARWRALRDGCAGIDLPTEREWEVAVTMQVEADTVVRYPWSRNGQPGLQPARWKKQIGERLQSLDPAMWKALGSIRPWEYGPWLLPVDGHGDVIRTDLGQDVRLSPTGVWDANGVAQWTLDAAESDLSATVGTRIDVSRCVRGSGWGPGRDELYRCAYRRAFTPDFSSFLTGCRLVWRREPLIADPVCDDETRATRSDAIGSSRRGL